MARPAAGSVYACAVTTHVPESSELAADVTLDADGIVVLRFKPGQVMRLENTRRVMEAHREAAGGQARPALADLRLMGGGTFAARSAVASEEMSRVISRMALLVQSPATRMMGNFFLRVSQPPFLTRMFTDEQAARRWLRGDDT